MSPRLKNIIALWFVLQIVVPFTAPLQTLALSDLFPAAHHHGAPVSQESSATPTLRTDSAGVTLVSLLGASTLRVATRASIGLSIRPAASHAANHPSPLIAARRNSASANAR
jgi:hypothetical protein